MATGLTKSPTVFIPPCISELGHEFSGPVHGLSHFVPGLLKLVKTSQEKNNVFLENFFSINRCTLIIQIN